MNIENRDLLSVTSGFIVHQVNCRKVMGAGLAKQIKLKWPIVYTSYMNNSGMLGSYELILVAPDLYVVNLYGQLGYGTDKKYTDYGAVSSALYQLDRQASRQPLTRLRGYFPYGMGAGLGGGSWEVISELIEFYFPDAIICKLE